MKSMEGPATPWEPVPIAMPGGKFRIGKHALRDPDHRQILLWAGALGLEPAEVIQRLESSSWEHPYWGTTGFTVENGSIVTLAWDFDRLPLSAFAWVDGLTIREIGFRGAPKTPPSLKLKLPSLVRLVCPSKSLVELDLSGTPALAELDCSCNQLTRLDLSKVPALTHLCCQGNLLTKLDLAHVPAPENLHYFRNQRTSRDCGTVPELIHLRCDDNPITELDVRLLEIRLLEKLTSLKCDPIVVLKKLRTQKVRK